MVFPPSALAILWGGVANVSIGPLLIAGIVPGILMALGLRGHRPVEEQESRCR
jgi:TRAP-type C4-dicarboxylate transport system permease large subunit